jgi:hypothetical protein
MASTETKTQAPSFESAFEQLREQSEQFLTASRKAANLYLDAYEKAVERTFDLENKFATLTKQEWLQNVIEAQADLQKEMVASYRTLLK